MVCTDELEVRTIPGKGRGVFARRSFAPGDVIERCPVIALQAEQWAILDTTALGNYFFHWGEQLERPAVALGYGSLYSHSFEPNAIYTRHLGDRELHFIAIREILPDAEVTVNYNGDPDDGTPVWFVPVD